MKGAPWRACDRAVCHARRPRGAPFTHPVASAFPNQAMSSSRSCNEVALHARFNVIPSSRHRSRHHTNKTKLAFRRLATSALLSPPRPIFRAIFSATLSNHTLYQPMTRTGGSGSRVSIPRDERSFLHLSRKEQSCPCADMREICARALFVPPSK